MQRGSRNEPVRRSPTATMESDANPTAPIPSVSLRLVTLDGQTPAKARLGEPLTIGLPVAQGTCRSGEAITVQASHGSPLPTQARVTDRWPDGSVRWVVIDTQVDVPAAPSHVVVGFPPAASMAGRAGITVAFQSRTTAGRSRSE